MPGQYITAKDAAKLLGYTVQHTRLLIREGKLPAEKMGRDWLVIREAVAQYRTSNPGIENDFPETGGSEVDSSNHLKA